ncbi:MAG: hypothetical protein QM765_42870 [Myxococcales bacterium]
MPGRDGLDEVIGFDARAAIWLTGALSITRGCEVSMRAGAKLSLSTAVVAAALAVPSLAFAGPAAVFWGAVPGAAAKAKKATPKPAAKPSPAPEEKAAAPAQAPSAGPAGAPTGDVAVGPRGPTRIDFDDRLIQGQTNKSGAVYLFDRKELSVRSMVRQRTSFRDQIVKDILTE